MSTKHSELTQFALAAVDVHREQAGTYNKAEAMDDLVRLHVKALGFGVNRNKFQFQIEPLLTVHHTAFGDDIPAYKTFEGKQVNRNHYAVDNGAATNEPIGYIETAEIKEDGVYLDLVLWKRTLSDGELSQLRSGTAHVSMEVEYTHAVTDGRGVRTMSKDSTVSFVGLAVLFDGIQPGDATSGIRFVENAMLQDVPEVTKQAKDVVNAASSLILGNDMTTPLAEPSVQELQAQLLAVQAELASEKSAREQAEVTAQDLSDAVKARDKKLDELTAMESEFYNLQKQVNTLREQNFNENLGKCFALDAADDVDRAFVRSLFAHLGGNPDTSAFVELAAQVVRVATLATEHVTSCAHKEQSTAAQEVVPAEVPQDTPAAEGDAEPAGEVSSENPEPTPVTPEVPAPAPSIAGGTKPSKQFGPEHLTSR